MPEERWNLASMLGHSSFLAIAKSASSVKTRVHQHRVDFFDFGEGDHGRDFACHLLFLVPTHLFILRTFEDVLSRPSRTSVRRGRHGECGQDGSAPPRRYSSQSSRESYTLMTTRLVLQLSVCPHAAAETLQTTATARRGIAASDLLRTGSPSLLFDLMADRAIDPSGRHGQRASSRCNRFLRSERNSFGPTLSPSSLSRRR